MRVALAFGVKQEPIELKPLDWFDDETYFSLGIARHPVVLQMADGTLFFDTVRVLSDIDSLLPNGPVLRTTVIADDAWEALLAWRQRVDSVLERLYAPLAPGFRGIGNHPDALADWKSSVRRRFGLGLEELANDRYDGFAQFARLSHLSELARHLAQQRFYLPQPSLADCLLAADLYPLQMHDGINLPIDMLYYLRRVETLAGVSLNRDWLAQ